jgi:hypothetical protein
MYAENVRFPIKLLKKGAKSTPEILSRERGAVKEL